MGVVRGHRSKKGREAPFSLNYRRFNLATLVDMYPLPCVVDCIDILGDASLLSTLDDNYGYWQIVITAGGRKNTCVTIHNGTYRYKRMLFGLRNAPTTFQRALYIVISGVRWQSCLFYMVD